MTAYTETQRLTKLIFSEIYGRKFSGRKELDELVIDLLRKMKQADTEYTYTSLFFIGTGQIGWVSGTDSFCFHVNVVYNNSYSVTTFLFNMLWNDEMFNNECYTTNIATFLGTPAYWFGPMTPERSVKLGITDERKTTI